MRLLFLFESAVSSFSFVFFFTCLQCVTGWLAPPVVPINHATFSLCSFYVFAVRDWLAPPRVPVNCGELSHAQ